MEVGEFYNNTVVKNKASQVTSGEHRTCGGIRIWVGETNANESRALIYNSIILGNEGA